MNKLLKTRTIQVIAAVMAGGILASVPFEHGDASNLSTTTLATKGQTGTGANDDIHKSQARTLSADGRVAVFSSPATNLVPGSSNGLEQIYTYDRISKKLELVSHTPSGSPGSGSSYVPSISTDGRYVIYSSTAHDLTPGLGEFCRGWDDPCTNIFVYDRTTKNTRAVNIASNGKRLPSIPLGPLSGPVIITRDGTFALFTSFHPFDTPNEEEFRLIVRNLKQGTTKVIELKDANGSIYQGGLWDATIDDSGRYIAFATPDNLVADDRNNPRQSDVYLYDTWNNGLTFVSKGLNGSGGDGLSFEPVISADGNFIVIVSSAGNLVPNDRNQRFDIFLYDRQKATTKLISNSTKGVQGTNNSYSTDISGDGQYIVYTSRAPNLVRPDTTNANVFLYYTNFGVTRLISRASHTGVPGDNNSFSPSISYDGKAVAFMSEARSLTGDPIPQNSFYNLFVAFDIARPIPYYDQADMLDLF